jgi:flagellar basal body-associated protein FliL
LGTVSLCGHGITAFTWSALRTLALTFIAALCTALIRAIVATSLARSAGLTRFGRSTFVALTLALATSVAVSSTASFATTAVTTLAAFARVATFTFFFLDRFFCRGWG